MKTCLTIKQILPGGSDEVVDPFQTLSLLGMHLKEDEINIEIDLMLDHRIQLKLLKDQVENSFSEICY